VDVGIGEGAGVGMRVDAGCVGEAILSSPAMESQFICTLSRGADALARRERDDFCFRSVILFFRLMVRWGWLRLRLRDEDECSNKGEGAEGTPLALSAPTEHNGDSGAKKVKSIAFVSA